MIKEYVLVAKINGEYRFIGELIMARKVVVRDKFTSECWSAYEYDLPYKIRGLRIVAGFTDKTKCSDKVDYELDLGGRGACNSVFIIDEHGKAVRLQYNGYYMTVTRSGVVEGLLYSVHTPYGELGVVSII